MAKVLKLILLLLFFLIKDYRKDLHTNYTYRDYYEWYTVEATVYHPCANQCNEDYKRTADMSLIDLDNVDSLRWIALSRDLLDRWGGDFNYGDTVVVEHQDETISGLWVIHDCMNARYDNKIDFLRSKQGFYGKWDSIKTYKYIQNKPNRWEYWKN